MAEQRDYGDEHGTYVVDLTEASTIIRRDPGYDPVSTTTLATRFAAAEAELREQARQVYALLLERDTMRRNLALIEQGMETIEAHATLDPRVAAGKNEKERQATLLVLCQDIPSWKELVARGAQAASDIAVLEAGIERARDLRATAKRVMDFEISTRLLEAYSRK